MKKSQRYIRQENLPQVGKDGQQRLRDARVLVIGAGGLGCAVLPYICAAGIGTVGIVDGDQVSESNLHRQVLYSAEDLDCNKAEVAAEKMKILNPEIDIQYYSEFFSGHNAFDILDTYDLVVDATDAIAARYLINDACVLKNKVFVHASIYRFQSQISVFNYNNGPTYRCLFPTPPKSTQSCAEAGVLGTSVGLAGMYQANEVMKIILNTGEVLSGKLLLIDNLKNTQNIFQFKKNENFKVTDAFFEQEHKQREEDQVEYATAIKREGLFLDVRGAEEKPKLSLESYKQIALQSLEENMDELPRDREIYVFCQSGKRSKNAYKLLKNHNFPSVFCLKENAPELKSLME